MRTAVLLGLALTFIISLHADDLPEINGIPENKNSNPVLQENSAVAEAKEKLYTTILPEDEVGFVRKGPPKRGQWLAEVVEVPQPLEQYRMSPVIRPTEERRTIVIQPLGVFKGEQKKVLEAMKEYAEIFFQLPVRIERPMELDISKPNVQLTRTVGVGQRRDGYTEQYLAEPILQYILQPNLPKDAAVYLGITMEDLCVQDLNYVFGLGSFSKRVGVYSLVRYYPEFWNETRKPGDDVKALRRACKVLNHETGHMFGLTHCVFYECSMNGANSLPETDSQPIHFCPVCQRKIQWNLGFNTTKQYEALLGFYKKYNMTEEAEWTEKRIECWKKVVEKEAEKKGDNNEPGEK